MSMVMNRRTERQARELLARAEALLGRASAHLLDGDALTAMRTLRAAEQLSALDSRLRAKRYADIQMREQQDDAERELNARKAELDHLERVLRGEEQRLRLERDKLKQTADTLEERYRMIYEGPPSDEDGPAPAMGEPTDSGVAPI